MFTTPLDHIATPERLMEALLSIRSKAVGIDGESLRRYRDDPALLEELSLELIDGHYAPVPMQRIELPKGDGETRPIALAAVRDKIVQKLLAQTLTPYFDPLFSDKSYGYRPGKGTLRAINRVRDYLRRGYRYIYKTDVEDFFERIPHERLVTLLATHIADRRIVEIVSRMLANGSFHGVHWSSHLEGVHQGDALSPLLSNLYLDQMDRWLEERNIAFVRFADDFVLLFKHSHTRDDAVGKLREFLQSIGLELGADKSYAAAVEEGFGFLGCRFRDEHVFIDNERLQKKVSKLYEMAKKPWDLDRYIDEMTHFVEGLQRYYLQIIDRQSPQFTHLESALIDSAARRFAREFASGTLRYKKEALPFALRLPTLLTVTKSERKSFAKGIVDRAKSMARDGAEPTPAGKNSLGAKRERIAKAMARSSTLVVEEYGSSLGVSKGRLTLKVKGKLRHKLPLKQCERIIIQTPGASLSSTLIHHCARRKIPVDFIETPSFKPIASLQGANRAYPLRMLKQMERYADPDARLQTARDFVRAKLKNQRNYLKYLDKHHRQLDAQIEILSRQIKRIKSTESVTELMGLEGSGSAAYWEGLGIVIADKLPFPGRIARGADDPVNSALNYGYAILYGEIRHALALAGLALHISYLHSVGERGEPTLVYDFIEPFRSFVVDRTIFTMINREEPIALDAKGMLDKKSRRLVAQNVIERLGSHTRHDDETKRLRTVIRDEAYAFARAVDTGERYRPFIGRY